jgi:hypothetical protein
MKFPVIVLLSFYAMEQLWITENVNKSIKTFRERRSIRHAADVFEVPRTCLRHAVIEGNSTKSKDGQTVSTPGNKNCSSL